jgi:hypothetical protein
MRARLQKFLPVVLIALAMQVLAPIAACWAAGLAVSDPLQNAAICHSNGASGPGLSDETGAPGAQAGSCSICCLAQASASLDAPQGILSTPFRHAERVAWHDTAKVIVASRSGSNAQARAPPQLS